MHHSFYASMQLLQQPQVLVKRGWKFLVVLLLGLMVVAGSLGGSQFLSERVRVAPIVRHQSVFTEAMSG